MGTLVDILQRPTTDVNEIYAALLSLHTDIIGTEKLNELCAVQSAFDAARTYDDKQDFLERFEVEALGAQPRRSPQTLKALLHYQWINSELYAIAQRVAVHHHIAGVRKVAMKEVNPQLLSQSTETQDQQSGSSYLEEDTLPMSIERAIQEDAKQSVSIADSFEKIRTMMRVHIEIVSTEHPTDGLSQEARETLDKLLLALCVDDVEKESVSDLLTHLAQMNSIPPAKRTVNDEIARDMVFASARSYDAIPHLMTMIVNAYARYYAYEFTRKRQEELWKILTGLESDVMLDGDYRLMADQSWPGVDGDGNSNVTHDTMRMTCRKKRVGICKKHIDRLKIGVVNATKEVEQEIRNRIIQRNGELLRSLKNADDAIFKQIIEFTTQISQALTDRKFYLAEDNCSELNTFISQQDLVEGNVKSLILEQLKDIEELIQVVKFSGMRREQNKQGHVQPNKGEIQELIRKFKFYIEQIDNDERNIWLKDETGKSQDATEYMLSQLQKIYRENNAIFTKYPQVKLAFFHFVGQFRCFGMTYGQLNMRQNSPVFTAVWEKLWEDFLNNKESYFMALHKRLCHVFGLDAQATIQYKQLTQQQKVFFFENLLMYEEGLTLLRKIKTNYNRRAYANMKFKAGKAETTVQDELARMEVIDTNRDMFNNTISSNVESVANYFESKAMHAVFQQTHQETPTKTFNRHRIVLLIETRQDLDNYAEIFTDVIKFEIADKLRQHWGEKHELIKKCLKINNINEISMAVNLKNRQIFSELLEQHPDLRELLRDIEIEVMFGYSDTERVAGLNALIAIDRTKYEVQQLTAAFGVTLLDFDGPGTDPNRGGPEIASRARKTTVQGIGRNAWLLPDAVRFREQQFYSVYTGRQPEYAWQKKVNIQEYLKNWEKYGAEFYEHIHDENQGIGQLLGFYLGLGPHWAQRAGRNHSSRANDRIVVEGIDLWAAIQTDNGAHPSAYLPIDSQRAITATQLKEALGENLHLVLGPGFGLRNLPNEGARVLYNDSPLARDIIRKLAIGLATANFDHARHALFAHRPDLLKQLEDTQTRQELARTWETTKGSVSLIDIKHIADDPEQRQKLYGILAQFFAYLQTEVEESRVFLWKLLREVHHLQMPETLTDPINLLHPWPDDQQYVREQYRQRQLAQALLARAAHHVNQGKKLHHVYPELGEVGTDQLTQLVGLLGFSASVLGAASQLPSSFHEPACNQESLMHMTFKQKPSSVGQPAFGLSTKPRAEQQQPQQDDQQACICCCKHKNFSRGDI